MELEKLYKTEIFDKLSSMVLNERQTKVYLALLKTSVSTASEIHKISGIPQNKIYGILDNLIQQGFVSKQIARTATTYAAIDPQVSMQQYIEKQENMLDSLHELRDDLLKLYDAENQEKEFTEYLEVIHGKLNIHKKFVELVRKSNDIILAITSPPYTIMSRPQHDEQIAAMQSFFRKNGYDKSLRELNDTSPAYAFDALRRNLNKKNSPCRITSESPIKLYIFDNKTLMTFNKSFIVDGGELCASVIKQPATVETYIQMFNYLWETGIEPIQWIAENQELWKKKLIEYDNPQEKDTGQ